MISITSVVNSSNASFPADYALFCINNVWQGVSGVSYTLTGSLTLPAYLVGAAFTYAGSDNITITIPSSLSSMNKSFTITVTGTGSVMVIG